MTVFLHNYMIIDMLYICVSPPEKHDSVWSIFVFTYRETLALLLPLTLSPFFS